MAAIAADIVNEEKAAALAALSVLAGDVSLCAISRAGTPYPAMKFREGAVSALAEAQRALADPLSQDAQVAALRGIRDSWRTRSLAPLAQAAAWRAYYAGGIDAVDTVLDQLRG